MDESRREESTAFRDAHQTSEYGTLCTAGGCTKGACIAGIVLQQSCPGWPCDEHGIDLQHSMAWSGVVIAPQSNAYPARATTRTATRVGLEKRILTKLDVCIEQVKRGSLCLGLTTGIVKREGGGSRTPASGLGIANVDVVLETTWLPVCCGGEYFCQRVSQLAHPQALRRSLHSRQWCVQGTASNLIVDMCTPQLPHTPYVPSLMRPNASSIARRSGPSV
jgi:hypothetical protein